MTKHSDFLLNLTLLKCPDGYEVRKVKISGTNRGSTLVCPKSNRRLEYQPLSNAKGAERFFCAAREFAGLQKFSDEPLNEKKLIKFTNEFGLLGNFFVTKTENLETWSAAINKFRSVYNMWKWGKVEEDRVLLNKAIEIYSSTNIPIFLRTVISDHINPGSRQLQIQPADLLSAMWLLLGEELSGKRMLVECANLNCSRWFKARNNKAACGTACRQALKRQRINVNNC